MEERAVTAAEPAAEPKPKLVWIEVTRYYPRGNNVHKPGARIQVPEYALESIEAARPPFGRRVEGPRRG